MVSKFYIPVSSANLSAEAMEEMETFMATIKGNKELQNVCITLAD